jgi:nucleoside-diphosphate-sugar epimerase
MKIAITGGAGFIGRNLKQLLEKDGVEVVSVDLRGETPIDILDVGALTTAFRGCHAVYHLAAEHRDDVMPRSRYYDVNVQGTKNVIKAAEENNISRIIFTSSFAVYGLNSGSPDEKSEPAPFNDYGRSKLQAETVLRDWQKNNGKADLTIVRPVVVFGGENRGNVHTLISQIAQGRFLMIGDGQNKKSMAYVGNVAAFLHFVLGDGHKGEIYNYADMPDYSTQELVSTIRRHLGQTARVMSLPYPIGLGAGYVFDGVARVTGRNFPISAVRIQKFCADTTCNARKAHATGFKALFTLEEGLLRMIEHDFPKAKKAA